MDKIIDAKIKMDQLEDANILHDSIDYLTKNYTLFDTYHVKIGLFRENPKRLITRLISGYGPPSLRPYFKKDFHIVVAQGCMGACTYCAIKFASGRLTSKPLDKILAEFRKGLSESYDVFRLTGEDVGAYGLDCDTSVVELLERLFNHKEHFRIILEDFNPRWLIRYSSELINLFVRNANRIHHIVLPIQSGSERIIQKMKRGYTGQRVAESLHCLQSAAPDIELSTHVIVGFPGETEDDFQDTVAFLREFSFKHIEAHKYSDRPNTPASKLSPRVPEAEKIRRLWLLRKEFPSECRIRI